MKRQESMGDRIKKLREAYGLTQTQFAEYVGAALPTIGNIERGTTSTLQTTTIRKAAEVFGTTVEWINNGGSTMLPNGKRDLGGLAIGSDLRNDEAWALAKQQLKEKDVLLNMLGVSFDRLTKMMQESGITFLQPVKGTARRVGT